MPYDDDPYWGGFNGKDHVAEPAKPKADANTPANRANLSVTGRRERFWDEVKAQQEKTLRAPKPSPLLQQYMEKHGIKDKKTE